MTELFSIRISGEYLHGLVESPNNTDTGQKYPALIFLNGEGGYRAGPHDLFVTLSRRLAPKGYYCVRFDFRGKGYSGDGERYDIQSALVDIKTVIDYIKTHYGITEIALFGMCNGAKLALLYAKNANDPIKQMILLSCATLRPEKQKIDTIAKAVGIHAEVYIRKVFKRSTWNKFFAGDIHYGRIWQIITSPLRNHAKHTLKKSGQKKPGAPTKLPFRNFHGPVLTIHAEKDPETLVALPQLLLLFEQYGMDYKTCVIPEANHNFYSIPWTEQIGDLMENWLIAQKR